VSTRRRVACSQTGTAALETMVVMSFLFTLIFGFVHLCMFAVTKSMTNYAAFTASRALLVGGSAGNAASQVMSDMQWWAGGAFVNDSKVSVQEHQLGPHYGSKQRSGVRIEYPLPFGYPIFRDGLGTVRAIGFAPTAEHPHTEIPEEGDNK
jgi:hypothetical protein